MSAEGIAKMRGWATADHEQAEAIRFFALVTDGSWPVEPPVTPNPGRAAQMRTQAQQYDVDGDEWAQGADEAEALERGDVEDPGA